MYWGWFSRDRLEHEECKEPRMFWGEEKKNTESVELARWLENLLSLEKSPFPFALSFWPCVKCTGKRVYELSKWTCVILCACLRQPCCISCLENQTVDSPSFLLCMLLLQLPNGIPAVLISPHIHLSSLVSDTVSKMRIRSLFREKQIQIPIRN